MNNALSISSLRPRTTKMFMLLLQFLVQRALADNPTSAPEQSADSGQSEMTSSEKTLNPIYQVASFFLESVITPGRLAELNETEDLSTFDAVLRSAEEHWQTWLRHYWSYVICLVLAAVYVLALPISGCLICGCRSRGRCVAGRKRRSGKTWRWYRRICTGLLLLLCIAVLLGVISMFLANKMIHERTRAEGVPRTIGDGFKKLTAYLQEVAADYDALNKTAQLDSSLLAIDRKLDNYPRDVQDRVGNETKIATFLDRLHSYVASRNKSITLAALVDDVNSKMVELDGALAEIRADVTRDIHSCTSDECQTVNNSLSSLQTVAHFTNVPQLSTVDGNITENLAKADVAYDKIKKAVENRSSSIRGSMKSKKNDIRSNFSSFLNETRSQLEDVSLDRMAKYANEILSPNIQKYGNYFYYVGLAVGSTILFIDLLYLLGLLYGACGSLDVNKAECCKKAKARSVLNVVLGFTFGFSWIIMLVIAVLFPVGGIVNNDLCRNLLLSAPDPKSAEVIDQTLSNSMNISWSVMSLYRHCNGDGAFLEEFVFETFGGDLNLSDVLDVNRYNIQGAVDQLKDVQYQTDTLVIISENLKNDLNRLNDTDTLLAINEYSKELNKPLMSGDLNQLAEQLTEIGNSSLNASAANVMHVYETEYQNALRSVELLNTTVADTESAREDLRLALVSLDEGKKVITPQNTSTSAAYVADDLMTMYSEELRAVRTSVKTSCSTVGDTISRTKDSICKTLAQPYNAFWLSVSWCLMFFILLIPNVLVLVDNFWPGRAPSTYRSSSIDDRADDNHGLSLMYDGQESYPRSKGRIPYEHLPTTNGVRSSPLSARRNHHHYDQRQPNHRQQHDQQRRVADDWDWQPDDAHDDRRRYSPPSYDRRWINMAYDDGFEGRVAEEEVGWRRQAHEQHRNNDPYRGDRQLYRGDYRANNGRSRRYDNSPPW
ncbi:hypothetical protein LSH36_294g02011 [Paralvinella palmiformis]|uniref:Prominin-like protein n=1 Tax=Paralvinella palmiformis TaxID=53620 RepID=A0AAD9N1Q8_9ANNE|nr:hypothetical protein LSH36_294g02011 [Paralvinella palmiformis]